MVTISQTPIPTFEYCYGSQLDWENNLHTDTLHTLGAQGWEAVCQMDRDILFKRPTGYRTPAIPLPVSSIELKVEIASVRKPDGPPSGEPSGEPSGQPDDKFMYESCGEYLERCV